MINILGRGKFIKFNFVVSCWRNDHITLDPVHEREANLWLTLGCQQGAKDQFTSGMNEAENGLFICLIILHTVKAHTELNQLRIARRIS